MENNFNQETPNSSWSTPNELNKQNLPNSTGAFVLGIVSICSAIILCCCYGYIIGLITSIIGLVLGNGAMKTYRVEPGRYTEASFRKAKNGRMLSIIGLVTSLLIIALVVLLLVLKATGNLPDEFEKYDRYNRNF